MGAQEGASGGGGSRGVEVVGDGGEEEGEGVRVAAPEAGEEGERERMRQHAEEVVGREGGGGVGAPEQRERVGVVVAIAAAVVAAVARLVREEAGEDGEEVGHGARAASPRTASRACACWTWRTVGLGGSSAARSSLASAARRASKVGARQTAAAAAAAAGGGAPSCMDEWMPSRSTSASPFEK